jgi:hypothetical protein
MASHVYLERDDSELVCHCNCDNALITFPPQMDCPWCGCGWLFTCIECRKAFTFARGVKVKDSWEELARRDLANRSGSKPSKEDISGWVVAMKELMAGVQVGERYVCFDGYFVQVDEPSLRFEGWHSRHKLDFVPQVAALKDPSITQRILSNPEYWRSRALENPDG